MGGNVKEKSVRINFKKVNEDTSLACQRTKSDLSGIRWYVIAVVSLATVLNNFLWATWGPISQSAYLVYGWTENQLFWIVNIGNITGFLSVLLGVYLVDSSGIRVAMIVSTITMTLATTTRVITLNKETATILIAIGQGINGIALSVTTAIPTVVSKTWFRVTERTTATAVSVLAAALGGAAAFLFGPLTVSMPKLNGTKLLLNETAFGFAVFLMLCCIVYLPTKPNIAPSKTASIERYSLKEGIFKLVKNKSIWFIAAIYAIPVGFFGNWLSILDVVLNPYMISQTDAGWMCFYGNLAGVFCGVLIGRFADLFQRRTKAMIIVLYVCAAVDFALFTCMCVGIFPKSKGAFYATIIVGSAVVNSCMPLFLEITCETSYPVTEGVTAGFLGMIVNLGATLFMGIELIPNLDTGWANWALVGVFVLAVPLMLLFKADYKRLDIDMLTDESVP